MLIHRSLLLALASSLMISSFTLCMEKPDNHKQVTTSKKKRPKHKVAHTQQQPAPLQLESLDRSKLKKLYFENASVAAPLTPEKKKSSPEYQQKKKIFGILLSLNGGDKAKTNEELYGEAEYSDDENNNGFDLEKRYRHSRNHLRYSIPTAQQNLEAKKRQSDSKAKEISDIDEQIVNLKKERKKRQAEQTDIVQEIYYLTQATRIFLAKREADKVELISQAHKKEMATKKSEEKLKKIANDKKANTDGAFNAKQTSNLSQQEADETKNRDELVQQQKAIEDKIKKLDNSTSWF